MESEFVACSVAVMEAIYMVKEILAKFGHSGTYG